MANIRGKSIKAITHDVSDGYVAVNPIFLKSFEPEILKEFYNEIMKVSKEIRSERFPAGDIEAIRLRNLKLQRLSTSVIVVRNFARERRIPLI
jgi:hypothetical protein